MEKNKNLSDKNKAKTFGYFFTIFLISGSLWAGMIGMIYNLESKDYLKQLKLEEQVNIKLQQVLISNYFDNIISDILFLTKQNELLNMINFEKGEQKEWISNEYLEMITMKKIYDQIRYLDANGMEIVRVNYNNGNPIIVKKDNLQLKRDRYYFKDTFKLGFNGLFISPLDLNVEKGQIEKPFKSTIRFGVPVFNAKKQKCGVILINYLGSKMLTAITETAKLSLGSVMLINSDSYWLLSPQKQDEWGFMIEGRQDKKFSNSYPKVWKQILASKSSQIQNAHGLFTSATIYPLKQNIKDIKSSSGSAYAAGESQNDINAEGYFWKITSYISEQTLNAGMSSLRIKLIVMTISLFLVSAIPSWLIATTISRRKLYRIQLYHSANHDKLTDLPNRAMFMDRLNEVLKQSIRYDKKCALLFIDLDGFKAVNDTFGHDAGDELLIKVAKRLQSCVRDSDIVARIGGDEFTVIFTEINKVDDAGSGAQKIIEKLAEPFNITGHEVKIGASIGVSTYPDHGKDGEVLLKKSDTAMYQAKNAGKNTFKISKKAIRKA